MTRLGLFLALPLALIPANGLFAAGWRNNDNNLHFVNAKLKGMIVDHTANHGRDNRMWSQTLYQRRDLYVYVPPGFSRQCKYPMIVFLHPAHHDEQFFLHIAAWFDEAIACGKLPPCIIAVPDGTVHGYHSQNTPNTYFLNSQFGDFEDLVVNDIWDYMARKYPVRPEKNAHILFGYSMGGFGAYSIGIRRRDCYGAVVGIHPPLNMRWEDKQGNYLADFDPHNWGWANQIGKAHLLSGFYHLLRHPFDLDIRAGFGHSPMAMQAISQENPIELIDRTSLRHGDLEMYVAYGKHDEFNVDAQVESFLYLCQFRGIAIGVGLAPEGRHNMATAHSLFPGIVEWLAPRLRPYSPILLEARTAATKEKR